MILHHPSSHVYYEVHGTGHPIVLLHAISAACACGMARWRRSPPPPRSSSTVAVIMTTRFGVHRTGTARAPVGRIAPIVGWAGPDDDGELACGMAAAVPPDLAHGDADRKIRFLQELGQTVRPNTSQVLHGRYSQVPNEYPAELRRRQMHTCSNILQPPILFGMGGEKPCCTVRNRREFIGCITGLGVVAACLLISAGAHWERLRERACLRGGGGEDPVVLNRSTHASTGRSFGSPVARTR